MEYSLFENYLPQEAIDIRYKVFTLEQGFDANVDLDEMDNKSIHILVYIDKKPIATGRMFKESKDSFHIGRLAVLKEYRDQGVGSFVLAIFERKAKDMGATSINIGSQIDKAEFYEKNGYKKYGDIFDDAGYPHIMMNKVL